MIVETCVFYRAFDGTRFETEKECLGHEDLLTKLVSIFLLIQPLPKNDGSNFANGKGYIQHTHSRLQEYASALCALALLYMGKEDRFRNPIIKFGRNITSVDVSIPGRWVFEFCPGPLRGAFVRLCCVDYSTYREYGQPYYAAHPYQAVQEEIK